MKRTHKKGKNKKIEQIAQEKEKKSKLRATLRELKSQNKEFKD